MHRRAVVAAAAALLAAAAVAAPGHRMQSVLRLGSVGGIADETRIVTWVTATAARQEKGDSVVLMSFERPGQQVLTPSKKTWVRFDGASGEMMKGFGSGIVQGMLQAVGVKSLDFAGLKPTGEQRKVKLGRGSVHALTQGAATVEVVVVEGLAPEVRSRLLTAEQGNVNAVALVPVEVLQRLPGHPALVQLTLRHGGQEVRFIHETLSIEPADVPDASLVVPAGWTLEEDPMTGLDRVLSDASRKARIASKPPSKDLFEAIAVGDLDAIRSFVAAGASVSAPHPERKMPPLHLAAEAGDAEAVRTLLSLGAPVDGRDDWKRTPLHLAAGLGKLEVARVLIEAGADLSPVNDFLNTPLSMAERNRKEAVAELLRARGAKSVERDLKWAAVNGDVARLEELIASGADVSAVVHDEATPVVLALRNRHHEAAELLLASGAKTDVPVFGGLLVLHVAARWGDRAFVDTLLRLGVPVDQRAPAGNVTPLHGAAEKGRADVVKLLLEKGADRTLTDGAGRTAAQIAEAAGHADVVALLKAP